MMEQNTSLVNEAVNQESSPANNTAEVTTQENTTQTNSTLVSQDPDAVEVQTNQGEKTDSNEAEKAIEYTDFKLPEGFNLDPKVKDEFVSISKELKLNQDQAQKFVDLQVKHVQEMNERIQSDFKKTITDWQKETITELGANYKQELKYVAKAIKAFGSPELTKLLDLTGLGNNKEMVRLLSNAGKTVSDDSFVDGSRTNGEESLAKRLYPNQK